MGYKIEDSINLGGITTPSETPLGTDFLLYVKPDGNWYRKNSSNVEFIITGSSYVSKIANYTLTASDYTVDCTSGTFTVILPTAIGIAGKIYVVKKTTTGIITVATTSSELIDGVLTFALNKNNDSLTFQSTGAGWIII